MAIRAAGREMPIIKVFSATLANDRNALGERLTAWLRGNPDVTVDEIRTLQSSDEAYHCLSLVVIGKETVKEMTS